MAALAYNIKAKELFNTWPNKDINQENYILVNDRLEYFVEPGINFNISYDKFRSYH